MSRAFKRTIEDFVCEHCRQQVKGNGYTNHCHQCLYSKHVDIYPGDREESCGGLMKPIRVELKGREYVLIHKCITCSFERKNRVDSEDAIEAILKIMRS